MIVKRFILGNSEELPELLKVSSKGIDTSHLEKTASSDMLSKADIKPEPGCSYIYLVTTGAEEYYGSNNNADSFNESSRKVTFPMAEKEASYQLAGGLKEYHKTYRDYGGVYKNHNNSKKGYDKQGEIVYENYNPDMHRGELIIKVANDLKDSEGKPVWHDTIEKLAQDKPVLFSQGCSVPFDIASCCGRIAHKSSEHCDHFKNHRLEFLKSGQQIFVYNDQPYFHDISEVDKPADRIAMALQKVAGENSGGYPSELNKEAVTPEGLSIPYHLMEKLGTKDQQDRSRVLLKLSELEKRVPMIAEDVKEPLSCGRDLSEGEEEEVIKNLKDIPEDIIIDSLQKRNMMLTPKGFCAILLKKNPSEISGFGSIKKALENVFTKIREEKDPNEILSDGLYKPIAPLRHPGAEDRIKKLSGLLSLDPEPLQSRIVKITVRGDGEDKKEKEAASAEITPEVEKIAEEYAKYQLSFLSSGKEDNGKLLLTVLSNQQ